MGKKLAVRFRDGELLCGYTTSWTPEAISEAPKFTACCADPHWRSMVTAGTVSGQPAARQSIVRRTSRSRARLVLSIGSVIDFLAGLGIAFR